MNENEKITKLINFRPKAAKVILECADSWEVDFTEALHRIIQDWGHEYYGAPDVPYPTLLKPKPGVQQEE